MLPVKSTFVHISFDNVSLSPTRRKQRSTSESRLCTMPYFTLLADMAVLSIRVSAYAFAGGRMLSEVLLSLIALVRQYLH